IETKTLEFFGERFLVEDAKDSVFTVTGGHDGNAKIDVAALVFDAEAAVLRNAALGDIEIAEDLNARKNSGVPFLSDRLHGVLKDAVDAVLDGDFGVARFDVNIGGTSLERGEDDGFDETDDGAGGGVAGEAITGNGL